MKCPECGGSGKVDDKIIIPLWHGEADNVILEVDSITDHWKSFEGHNELETMAKRFHEILRSHGHGVFHDTLRNCFRETLR